MRKVEIVLGLLEQDSTYLLQHRLGHERIGAAGRIGCFGGKVEEGELPRSAVSREISEETTLESKPEAWELLGEVNVESDHQLEPVKVHATIFRHVLSPKTKLEAKEGKLVRIQVQDIPSRINEFTPATRALFEEIIVKER